MKCEMDVLNEHGEAEECGTVLSEKVYNYSKNKWGKAICYDCQHNNPLAIDFIEAKEKENLKKPKDITHEYIKSDRWEKDIISDIVSFERLLNDAHNKFSDRFSIQTWLVSHDTEKKSAVFKCRIKISGISGEEPQIFEGYGDADQDNCQSNFIKPHYLRMAETRAICRALRWATNNAQTAEEEK